MTAVLVVDDSKFMRTVLTTTLSENGYEVHSAANGREAIEAVDEHSPDIVTMDVEMPGMSGLTAVERIMATNPTPILMVSAHTDRGADVTLAALARGAVDFITKPGETTRDESFDERLLEAVAALEAADPRALLPDHAGGADGSTRTNAGPATGDADPGTADRTTPTPQPSAGERVPGAGAGAVEKDSGDRPRELPDVSFSTPPTVVVGASAGGPKLVEQLLAELPTGLRARVLVVQHMPTNFTGRLAKRLDSLVAYDVSEATQGGTVAAGEVAIAKGDYHMAVDGDDGRRLELALHRGERVHGVRPAIDVTMKTAAETVAGPLVGVALSGMGSDGAAGIAAIKRAGGHTIAQDEATSPVFGIPRKAIETGYVDDVLPIGRVVDGVCGALERAADGGIRANGGDDRPREDRGAERRAEPGEGTRSTRTGGR